MSNSATPLTDELQEGVRARVGLRGFGMPQDYTDAISLARQLERSQAALVEALSELTKYAESWSDTGVLVYAPGSPADKAVKAARAALLAARPK